MNAGMPGSATIDFDVVSTDFEAARRRNSRKTIVLAICLTSVFAAFGYLVGWGMETLSMREAEAPHDAGETFATLWTQISHTGLRAAGMALVGGALWTSFALIFADRSMLWIAGARPADRGRPGDLALCNMVEEMAIAAGVAVPGVHVIEDDGLNAFATGLRRSGASIAVTRGLLTRLNREEMQSVIGHEMAHILNGDVRLMVAAGAMVGLVSFVADMVLRTGAWGPGSSRSGSSRSSGVVLAVFAVWIIGAIIAWCASELIRFAISREREYMADATSVMLTRNPRALASALAKISENPGIATASKATAHLFICEPFSGLLSTHPPVRERIARILDLR